MYFCTGIIFCILLIVNALHTKHRSIFSQQQQKKTTQTFIQKPAFQNSTFYLLVNCSTCALILYFVAKVEYVNGRQVRVADSMPIKRMQIYIFYTRIYSNFIRIQIRLFAARNENCIHNTLSTRLVNVPPVHLSLHIFYYCARKEWGENVLQGRRG